MTSSAIFRISAADAVQPRDREEPDRDRLADDEQPEVDELGVRALAPGGGGQRGPRTDVAPRRRRTCRGPIGPASSGVGLVSWSLR